MIWDNFSIFRTNWFTLTTCICLDPRKCGMEMVTLTCRNIMSLWEPISEASNISQSGLCFARHKCFSRRQLSGNISGKHKQAGEDSEKHCLLPWVTRPCDEANEMSLSFLVKTSSSNVNNLPYKNCELNWWKTHPGICETKVHGEDDEDVYFCFYRYRGAFMCKPQKFSREDRG